MGKKRSRRVPQGNNYFSSPATKFNARPSTREENNTDEIRQELETNEQQAEFELKNENNPIDEGRKSLSVLDMSFDEFEQEVEIPLNDETAFESKENPKPKHAYQTVYMSHENVTSPEPFISQQVFHRSNASIASRASGANNASSSAPIAKPRSRLNSASSSNYNKLVDGGAYQDFHASRQSLNKEREKAERDVSVGSSAHNRTSHSKSFLSDAAEERSLAGFPRSSFGGSRSSVHASRLGLSAPTYEDNQVRIRRESQLGELEHMHYSGRSRSNSGVSSGAFGGNDVVMNEYVESPTRSRVGRSRTVSECSKKSGNATRDVPIHTSTSMQIRNPNDASEIDVRTYHADSEYLQNRLSKLSIHTNNDEFVLVGGHPPNYSSFTEDYSGRSNIPAIRVNDQTFQSDLSSSRNATRDRDGSGRAYESQPRSSYSNSDQYDATASKTQSMSKTSLTATGNRRGYEDRSKSMSRSDVSQSETMPKYSNSSRNVETDDELGKSISQRSISNSHRSISRASSKHTIATTSNTDDRLLLAARYSQSPEAEGLITVPSNRSRNQSRGNSSSNIATLVNNSHRSNRSASVASNASDRVHFAEIPTLFSHPDDTFGENGDDGTGVPFRPTNEHQHTPSNIAKQPKASLRSRQQQSETRSRDSSVESSNRSGQPSRPLLVTSALTPIAPRRTSAVSVLEEDSALKTPQTVQRVQEAKCIRQVVQPLTTTKKTSEIAIQTGDTIRLRQGKWNPDVLSEFAYIGTHETAHSAASTPNEKSKPKMNNSFERNGHPAASVLNNMLQTRVDRNPSVSGSDADVQTSRSNSSHQVTMVHTSQSQTSQNTKDFRERLRNISERYQNGNELFGTVDENGNATNPDEFITIKPLSTSTPAKTGPSVENQHGRRDGTSGSSNVAMNEQGPYQRTGSERSIPTIEMSDMIDGREVDARWIEGKRTNGDTIRKHVPRGRIRDLASAFENLQTHSPRHFRAPSPVRSQLLSPASFQNETEKPVQHTSMNSDNSRKDERREPSVQKSSSNHLNGSSMSSNPFLSSSTLQSQGDARYRSTSSSSQQPGVFTRNTFLRSSINPSGSRSAEKSYIPKNAPTTVNYAQQREDPAAQGDGGFVSMFESIPSVNRTGESRPNRDFSTSPTTQQQQEEFRRMQPAGAGDRFQMSSDDVSGSHRRSRSVAPLVRGDDLRSSWMPKRETKLAGNTPILRRQTAVVEGSAPCYMKEDLPKTTSARDFHLGSTVEIPINERYVGSTEPITVPIQKTTRRSGDLCGSYVDIPKPTQPYEVPILSKVDVLRKRNMPIRVERAKTQEVPAAYHHEPKYDARAVSGEIGEEKQPEKSFFRTGRDAFGRQTTENLYESQKAVDSLIPSSWNPQRNEWKTTTTTTSTYSNQKILRKKERNMFEERRKQRELEEVEKAANQYSSFYTHSRPLEVSPKVGRSDQSQNHSHLYEKHPSKLNVPSNLSRHASSTIASNHNHPYSPPATEDAGSRITHHTSTTLHDDVASYDNRLTNEDSSIRGKIDRMFEFVENDDSSRKTLRASSTLDSTDTVGRTASGRFEKKDAEKSPAIKYSGYVPVSRQRMMDEHGEWERVLYNSQPYDEGVPSKAANFEMKVKEVKDDMNLREASMSPRRRTIERQLQSPERRNTVAVNEVDGKGYNDDFEYSLSQYRQMQREQFRNRLGSTEEPQFFRSPSLTPHAGQSLHAYRSRDFLGTPTSGEKFRFNTTNNNLPLPPTALATSTPIDSPQMMASYSSRARPHDVNHNSLHPNETFVSSISGVSTVDNRADIMKRINRLSYMIEVTQKQMTMNEAALSDALKKGKQYNEIAANRSILITRETLKLQRAELRRLHALSAVRRPPPPVARELRGNVTFSNVSVQLNKNFCSRLTPADSNTYAFVALFKCGHQVEATEFIPLRVENDLGVLDRIVFEQQIQFSDVPADFSVHIDFYAMRVSPSRVIEHSLGSAFAAKCKNLIGPPQKKPLTTAATETAFKVRGRITLDRDASGERGFYLDDVTYPLEGTVLINTKCSRLPDAFEVDFRGFMTMFLTISNMASWERYWAVLRRGVVYFWKYPDEEQMGKEPRMQIDLTKCTNNSIEQCNFEVCPRPNSFAVEILVDTEEATVGSIVEKKRVLLSADSPEMLNQWLFALNQTLDVIRGPI